jgi:hypothetical protein
MTLKGAGLAVLLMAGTMIGLVSFLYLLFSWVLFCKKTPFGKSLGFFTSRVSFIGDGIRRCGTYF